MTEPTPYSGAHSSSHSDKAIEASAPIAAQSFTSAIRGAGLAAQLKADARVDDEGRLMDDVVLPDPPTSDVVAKPAVGTPEEPARAQTLVRSSAAQKDRWAEAAEAQGKSVTLWVRELLDAEAEKVLVCQHLPADRKTYTWSDFCTACNTRLR